MGNIPLENILSGKEELIDSALRSALIFNSKAGVIDYDGVLAKAILGYILDRKELVSNHEIVVRFSSSQDAEETSQRINGALSLLLEKQLIIQTGNKYAYSPDQEDAFFDELKAGTRRLVEKVRKHAEDFLKHKLKNGESFIDTNIQKALSIYLNQFSYSLFEAKKPADSNQTLDAIQICKKGINDPSDGEALVLSLSETIQNPDAEDKDVLETWAKAYFAAAVTGTDPMLNHLHSDKMRGKIFVLDTDIVLHCLVDYTRESKVYSTMVRRLLKMGCKVIIPEDVLLEVRCHAEAAKKRFKAHGSELVFYSDDMLDSEVNNVFIENFVHMVQSDDKQDRSYSSFAQLVNNVCDPSYPELLKEDIEDRFGKTVTFLDDISIDTEELSIVDSLSDKILRITEMSEKAQFRTEEDNERISKTDARLYYYVYHANENTDSKEFLSSKVYLLTNTTKSIKAAREINFVKDNIICNPSVLTGVLMQIGVVPEKEEVLNLFENPFLAYTGAMIWEKIEPLVRAGAHFKEASIRWMHKNYADNLDKILTEETIEGKFNALKELNRKGLVGIFTEEQILETYAENKRLKEEIEKRDEVIKRYKTRERLYAKPLLRGKSGKPSKNSGHRSKKK